MAPLITRLYGLREALISRTWLNTIFGHVLAKGTPLDAFIAGDSAEAESTVAAFLESLEVRTLDAGGLQAAPLLESAGLLLMGLARNGAGFDLALGAEVR